MASATQILANARYREKAYDRVSIDVKKGKRDFYNLAAKELGISLAMLLQIGAEEYIKNHAGEDFILPTTTSDAEKLSAADRRLLENFASLPKSTQKKILGLIDEFIELVDQKEGA